MRSEGHTLVVYAPSKRADSVLRDVAEAAAERGSRLTVLFLVVQEPEKNGCCDTRSVLWNEIVRDLASDGLVRARSAVADDSAVEFETLVFSGRRGAEALIREAITRDADEIDARGRTEGPDRCVAAAPPAPQEPGAGA